MTHPEHGIEDWDENHKLKAEVHEILTLISEANIILATGHITPQEVILLVQAAEEHSIEKILIQHTDLGIARIPFDLQLELAGRGAILEKCYLACSKDFEDITLEEMAYSIQRLGSECCVMVTDYGQEHNIAPVEALSHFVEYMLSFGITERQIEQMLVNNPRALLGI